MQLVLPCRQRSKQLSVDLHPMQLCLSSTQQPSFRGQGKREAGLTQSHF